MEWMLGRTHSHTHPESFPTLRRRSMAPKEKKKMPSGADWCNPAPLLWSIHSSGELAALMAPSCSFMCTIRLPKLKLLLHVANVVFNGSGLPLVSRCYVTHLAAAEFILVDKKLYIYVCVRPSICVR